LVKPWKKVARDLVRRRLKPNKKTTGQTTRGYQGCARVSVTGLFSADAYLRERKKLEKK